jgi:hypothetical protein
MKRVFNLFMKEVNPKYKNLGELTTMFNHWVVNAEKEKGVKRFEFKAYTNKRMVMKWLKII